MSGYVKTSKLCSMGCIALVPLLSLPHSKPQSPPQQLTGISQETRMSRKNFWQCTSSQNNTAKCYRALWQWIICIHSDSSAMLIWTWGFGGAGEKENGDKCLYFLAVSWITPSVSLISSFLREPEPTCPVLLPAPWIFPCVVMYTWQSELASFPPLCNKPKEQMSCLRLSLHIKKLPAWIFWLRVSLFGFIQKQS